MIKIIRNSGVEEIDADYIVDVFNLDGKKVKFSFDTNSKLLYIVTTSHGNNHTAMNGEFLQVIYSNKRLERKRKLERIVK